MKLIIFNYLYFTTPPLPPPPPPLTPRDIKTQTTTAPIHRIRILLFNTSLNLDETFPEQLIVQASIDTLYSEYIYICIDIHCIIRSILYEYQECIVCILSKYFIEQGLKMKIFVIFLLGVMTFIVQAHLYDELQGMYICHIQHACNCILDFKTRQYN